MTTLYILYHLTIRNRRAIKIAETHNPESVAAFVTSFGKVKPFISLLLSKSRSIGGENALARSLFKRLETEGDI